MKHKVSDEVKGLLALEKRYSREIERAKKVARCERRAYFTAKAVRDEANWSAERSVPRGIRKLREKKAVVESARNAREDRFCKTGGFKLTRENVMSQGKHIRVCGMRSKSLHELSWKF